MKMLMTLGLFGAIPYSTIISTPVDRRLSEKPGSKDTTVKLHEH